MRYKVKSIAGLNIALGGLPSQTRVEIAPNIDVTAKTVGELRELTAWPEVLAITVPQLRQDNVAVHVSKPNVAARVSPKP